MAPLIPHLRGIRIEVRVTPINQRRDGPRAKLVILCSFVVMTIFNREGR